MTPLFNTVHHSRVTTFNTSTGFDNVCVYIQIHTKVVFHSMAKGFIYERFLALSLVLVAQGNIKQVMANGF